MGISLIHCAEPTPKTQQIVRPRVRGAVCKQTPQSISTLLVRKVGRCPHPRLTGPRFWWWPEHMLAHVFYRPAVTILSPYPNFPPFILRSRSLVPYSFPHAPLGPSPNHLTSHLMDHMTNPQSTITCHHSAVRSIMTCPHLTLYGLPAHDAPLRSRQLMMELYLELPRHDEPY